MNTFYFVNFKTLFWPFDAPWVGQLDTSLPAGTDDVSAG